MNVLRTAVVAVALLLGAAAAACGGAPDRGPEDPRAPLVVYSGRAENLVGPLFERFERATDIPVEVRYGDSAELAATLGEEGGRSRADVFFAQDAGSLGAVANQGLLRELPPNLLERVPARFRDPERRWVGTSGRARVVAYDTRKLRGSELPETIFDFTQPRWRGKIGLAPTNASFQAFVSAMRLEVGDERTREWLERIDANEPTLLENNLQTLEAIARGEVEVGFVNHYYLYELRRERPDLPVENHFLRPGDPGSLVNVAGIGELASAPRPAAARRFVEFLLSVEGQRYFATDTEEYPLIRGVRPDEDLRPLATIHGPDVSLGALGEKLPSTAQMIAEAGLGS
jgi:iron(III) transport system substrate-binding protein